MTRPATIGARLASWRPPRGAIGIVALGQAGFALRGDADLVLVDPFLSPRPDRLVGPILDPGSLHGVRAVLATHEHEDHLDLPAWTVIARASPDTLFVVPAPLVPMVTSADIPGDRVIGARIGVPIQLGAARATAVPARHAVSIEDGYTLGDGSSAGAQVRGLRPRARRGDTVPRR